METIFKAVCVGVSFIFLGIRNDAGLLALFPISFIHVSVAEMCRQEKEGNCFNDLDSRLDFS